MEKKPFKPATHAEMIRQYPITGVVEGWYFRKREVSAGCYLVEGSDIYGHQISRQTGEDGVDRVYNECVEYARQLSTKG